MVNINNAGGVKMNPSTAGRKMLTMMMFSCSGEACMISTNNSGVKVRPSVTGKEDAYHGDVQLLRRSLHDQRQ